MAEGPTSHAATANCPMLCVIPPATLTPKVEMCKWVLFSSYNAYGKRLVEAVFVQNKYNNQISKPQFDSRKWDRKRKKTFNITEYESDGGKNSKFSDCVDVRFHISLLFGIIVQ